MLAASSSPSKSSTTSRLRPSACANPTSSNNATTTARENHLLDFELVIAKCSGFGFAARRGPALLAARRDAAEEQREVARAARMLHSLFVRNESLLHECRKALIERDHA